MALAAFALHLLQVGLNQRREYKAFFQSVSGHALPRRTVSHKFNNYFDCMIEKLSSAHLGSAKFARGGGS
jgi:hypothetical protein